uniref:Shisa family member 4 n=1 Tax=Monodelphis domestica TaxID=13616 RepID=A0A5F8GNF3_MONDO
EANAAGTETGPCEGRVTQCSSEWPLNGRLCSRALWRGPSPQPLLSTSLWAPPREGLSVTRAASPQGWHINLNGPRWPGVWDLWRSPRCPWPVLADEDCLWYLDGNGSWHPGFDCEASFCCGTCYHRFCCRDLSRIITERQQKHCLAFSPKTIAGIASAVILFIAVVVTTICCFLCSCCYLYRRRQQLRTPLEVQEIPMTGFPIQPMYPYPQDPKAGPAPPQPGFVYPPSGPAPQYPMYPAGPPVYNPAAPPPYMPSQSTYPGA